MRVVDEVEVYLAVCGATAGKAQADDRRARNAFFRFSGVTQGDLDAALKIVQQQERGRLDEFFAVTQYELRQTLLETQIRQPLGRRQGQTGGGPDRDDFTRRVDAKLAEEGLDGDESDVRRGIEKLVAAEAQYQALNALTHEYLESVGVSYRPRFSSAVTRRRYGRDGARVPSRMLAARARKC